MKLRLPPTRRPRIEMLALIDIVFLLLVFFIFAMLSMAVHRGLPVLLPASSSAGIDKQLILSVSVRADGTVYLDKSPVALVQIADALKDKAREEDETGVLLFADRDLSYQTLFKVLDQIRAAGLERISLQALADSAS